MNKAARTTDVTVKFLSFIIHFPKIQSRHCYGCGTLHLYPFKHCYVCFKNATTKLVNNHLRISGNAQAKDCDIPVYDLVIQAALFNGEIRYRLLVKMKDRALILLHVKMKDGALILLHVET